jgi:DNA polymerase elongation subunit (family B)/DNA-directed RNA polymerase subunit RPC12/RpoP
MKKNPKILLFDIETMANLVYVWGKYEQDVIAYKRHWFMLSFAYKWLGEKKTYVHSLPDYPLYKKDKLNDQELVKELWKLFDEADIIIAHNGNSFDIKKANARFIKHKLPPPSPYRMIDTKLVAKKYLKMDSNKLDDIGDYFNIGRKINTGGFELWLGCEAGDKKAWKKMCDYNVQDVILLEKVYLEMLPYMIDHPHMGLLIDGSLNKCRNCGSTNIHKRGFGVNSKTRYQRIQCQDCGGWDKGETIKNGQKFT